MDETASRAFAEAMATACAQLKVADAGFMIYLQGDLGVGKSFFSRAFIQTFLPEQKVKSPTYTLVESYNHLDFKVHHFDLYRLCDSEVLEYLAIRVLLMRNFIALVEWPQKGAPLLPNADLVISFEHQALGRKATLQAQSPAATKVLERFIELYV
jgi:tRNA threonylcarbamoyladenosine biosynthesis protein TsaE